MKNYIILAICFFPLSIIAAISGLDQVINYFAKGDATSISRYLDSNVQLNINGKSGSYSNRQAEIILSTFFSEHPVSGFSKTHNGGSSDSAEFILGTLSTRSGSYKLSVFAKNMGGSTIIKEIRIE